jgi:ABC-2 type transport system ATP-binding protein
LIQIEDLGFRYPGARRDAIGGLSLRIREGSLFGLLGPNGSGKTTLISILTGLLSAVSGRVLVDGKALPAQSREVQAFSALVPQEYAFYPRLNVIENLRFFAGALGISAAEFKSRLDEALAVAGLETFETMLAGHLSGGLKRRLNLAIGLLNRPRLLFLDEPTVGIDPQSRRFILDAIKRINERGTTVVYTSHYMEEVELLCDEIGILDSGRLLAQGTLQQLLNDTEGHALTVSLLSEPTTQQRERLSTIQGLEVDDDRLQINSCTDAQLKQLVALLAEERLGIARLQYGYGNLEELFLHLTGRQLRD